MGWGPYPEALAVAQRVLSPARQSDVRTSAPPLQRVAQGHGAEHVVEGAAHRIAGDTFALRSWQQVDVQPGQAVLAVGAVERFATVPMSAA